MRSHRSHIVRRATEVVVVLVVLVLFAAPEAVAGGVLADPPKDLNTVINRITAWLVGLLVSLATLWLTVGAIRYLAAGGDPGEAGKGKDTMRNAGVGYGLAVLAPLLMQILKSFVGG